MMTEQVFHYTVTDEKAMEQVLIDDALHVNHIVLPTGESFPEHHANATVYMIVARGRLSIDLGDQGTHEYGGGDVLKIPHGTKMKGCNKHGETLELWIVKTFAT